MGEPCPNLNCGYCIFEIKALASNTKAKRNILFLWNTLLWDLLWQLLDNKTKVRQDFYRNEKSGFAAMQYRQTHLYIHDSPLTFTLREGFKKKKKKLGILPKGGGVPSDFGSVSQLFYLFLNMVWIIQKCKEIFKKWGGVTKGWNFFLAFLDDSDHG